MFASRVRWVSAQPPTRIGWSLAWQTVPALCHWGACRQMGSTRLIRLNPTAATSLSRRPGFRLWHVSARQTGSQIGTEFPAPNYNRSDTKDLFYEWIIFILYDFFLFGCSLSGDTALHSSLLLVILICLYIWILFWILLSLRYTIKLITYLLRRLLVWRPYWLLQGLVLKRPLPLHVVVPRRLRRKVVRSSRVFQEGWSFLVQVIRLVQHQRHGRCYSVPHTHTGFWNQLMYVLPCIRLMLDSVSNLTYGMWICLYMKTIYTTNGMITLLVYVYVCVSTHLSTMIRDRWRMDERSDEYDTHRTWDANQSQNIPPDRILCILELSEHPIKISNIRAELSRAQH